MTSTDAGWRLTDNTKTFSALKTASLPVFFFGIPRCSSELYSLCKQAYFLQKYNISNACAHNFAVAGNRNKARVYIHA